MVLCWGLRKSPLLGLWGLVPVWGAVTHWGFIHYIAALGLFAMALGLGLRLAERSTPQRQGLLAAVLILLFFTDVFLFPSTVLMLVVSALVMNRRVDDVRGVLIPTGVAAVLFIAWAAGWIEPHGLRP